MENRHGQLVVACPTLADGHAERGGRAAHDRTSCRPADGDHAWRRQSLRCRGLRQRAANVTPLVAQNTSGRSSAIDGRTTRHGGYAVSQSIRKRIEEAFGWIKTVAGQEKTSFRGRDRAAWAFTFAATHGLQSSAAAQADSGGRLMAKAPGFAKAFVGWLAHRRDGRLGQRLPRSRRRGASRLRGQVRR